MSQRPLDPRPPTHGQSTRLAQSAIASVDLCTRGSMHLHIGAMTLRIPPEAVSELLSTLGQAIAAYATRRFRYDTVRGLTVPTTHRGKA